MVCRSMGGGVGACCAAVCGGCCVGDAEEDASAILFSSRTLAWIWDGIVRVRIGEGLRHLKSKSSSVSMFCVSATVSVM